jgi:MFS family permease
MATARTETTTPSRDVNPNQLLYSLMIPAIIMPLSGWMFSVSLPIIRDDFSIAADLAAWIATAFTLPFMILMPVYGRISDGLGKRRLLLIGITIFAIGSLIATLSTNLTVLMLGRVIQGLGAAGLVPLSLALISEVFPAHRRGKAMGLWSTVGPVTGVIGPILAGYIVAAWGWRAAFIPAMLFALISLVVV